MATSAASGDDAAQLVRLRRGTWMPRTAAHSCRNIGRYSLLRDTHAAFLLPAPPPHAPPLEKPIATGGFTRAIASSTYATHTSSVW